LFVIMAKDLLKVKFGFPTETVIELRIFLKGTLADSKEMITTYEKREVKEGK